MLRLASDPIVLSFFIFTSIEDFCVLTFVLTFKKINKKKLIVVVDTFVDILLSF